MEILDTASSPENMVHFTDAELAPVILALTTKLFRRTAETYEVRVAKFQTMITQLSEVFGIPEVRVAGVVDRRMGYAEFEPGGNTIATEKHLSLVTVLHGFAVAVIYHKPELQGTVNEETLERTGYLRPDAFALSMFKQAAPQMFEEAKNRGRLYGTSVPYTDDGRLTQEGAEREAEAPHTGEDAPPEGGTTDLPAPPPAQRPVQPPQRPLPPVQRPDIDPENRDRGNGRGED